jgi:hypothetical protein
MALDLALGEGKVLLSFAVLAELYEVFTRKQFRRYVNEEDIRRFLAALTREAQNGSTSMYRLLHAAIQRTISSWNLPYVGTRNTLSLATPT